MMSSGLHNLQFLPTPDMKMDGSGISTMTPTEPNASKITNSYIIGDSNTLGTIEKLQEEGMPREQAEELLKLVDEQIEKYQSDFYEQFVHPHDYHQVISTLRQTQPSHLVEAQTISSHTFSHTLHQLRELDTQITQHRLELQKTHTDVKAGLQLDVSLERKRLDEVELALVNKARDGAEYAEGKVEECRQLSDVMWRRTYTGIASIGGGIIFLFLIFNSINRSS